MTLRIEILPTVALGLPPFAKASLRVPRFRLALSLESLEPPADAVETQQRVELAAEIERCLRVHQPPVAVLDSIRTIAEPGSFCVMTGQQPGFLGGPLYSLYKALHAVRLSRSLSQAWERPVVPVFWNHADDHDVAEVHHAWLLNDNLDLQRVGLAGLSSGRQPLSRVRLSEESQTLAMVREALRQMLARWPGAHAAIELFSPLDGDTLASAFTRSMTRLLGHLGLVVVEPDWIRPWMSRSLARIVRAPVRASLEDGESALRSVGVEPAIESSGAALVYRLDEQGRHALRFGGEGFQYDGEAGSRTPEELAAEIVQSPLAWSPGALLRPLVQDSVFPVAAYVGGWGELNYLAQLGPLRDAARIPHTLAVPRWSCTLVEPESSDALQRLELSIAAVLASRGQELVVEVAEAAPSVVGELRLIAERAATELAARKAALAELDRGLAASLPRAGDQIRSLVEKICEKAERVHANRQGRGRRLVRRVANSLCPRGELQERVLGALPFVARFGRSWIDELFDGIGAFETGHVVASFAAEDDPVKGDLR